MKRAIRSGNLFDHGEPASSDEQVDALVERGGVTVERIVSTGQASPPGFWYDQADDEFVVLLSGAARLRFEADNLSLDLKPGDWVEIPAHERHRVEWTQAEPPTVWLAVHRAA
jgi:cupin 2 domain-containing protein